MNLKLFSQSIDQAKTRLKNVVIETPLQFNERFSQIYGAKIFLKREDLQITRSYKLRGAYNCLSLLNKAERKKGVVCASAGNHAQGVAYSCAKLKIQAFVYMPKNTPKQKVDRVKVFGGKWLTLVLVGDTFDEANKLAQNFCKKENKTFIHPFDNENVIAGQGTIAKEIFEKLPVPPDYLIVPVGGGGLVSGIGAYSKNIDPKTKIIGVEPEGAASMHQALKAGKVISLKSVDKFVDGVAVKTVGQLTFKLAQKVIDKIALVPAGRVCVDMISMYQSDGIITEPAGVLSVSALESIKKEIKSKTVVCIISGGNNDISRYPEIIERSLIYRGLKHYFIIEFSQGAGSLKRYINEALGASDDITLFEYIKKNNRETGPALVGIELAKKDDLNGLLARMDKLGISYELLKNDSEMFKLLI